MLRAAGHDLATTNEPIPLGIAQPQDCAHLTSLFSLAAGSGRYRRIPGTLAGGRPGGGWHDTITEEEPVMCFWSRIRWRSWL